MERVESVSHKIFHQAKLCINFVSGSFYLFLPSSTTLNQLLKPQDSGLKKIQKNNDLWIDFIPFGDPNKKENTKPKNSEAIDHYRLIDFPNVQRRNFFTKNSFCLSFAIKDSITAGPIRAILFDS